MQPTATGVPHRVTEWFWSRPVLNGGASVAHFQRFVGLTANIGRFSHELADLQESMRSLRDMLATPSPMQFDAALTF